MVDGFSPALYKALYRNFEDIITEVALVPKSDGYWTVEKRLKKRCAKLQNPPSSPPPAKGENERKRKLSVLEANKDCILI